MEGANGKKKKYKMKLKQGNEARARKRPNQRRYFLPACLTLLY